MLSFIPISNILFLDIETVPLFVDFQQVSSEEKMLWEEKTQRQRQDIISAEAFYEKAGIFAEFGKIICISVGYFPKKEPLEFRVRSFTGTEVEILQNFSQLLTTYFSNKSKFLCAHNGKEFDFPFIARRMLINGLPLPPHLNLFGKKPWEVKHLDTLELWKFGDYKHYTSLKLLAYVLGIPSPKTDMQGDKVAQVYYKENNLERIVTYCQNDVITVAQIILRLKQMPLLTPEQIQYV